MKSKRLIFSVCCIVILLATNIIVDKKAYTMGLQECNVCYPHDCTEKLGDVCEELEGDWWYSGSYLMGSWCIAQTVCVFDYKVRCTTESPTTGLPIHTWDITSCVGWDCFECEDV